MTDIANVLHRALGIMDEVLGIIKNITGIVEDITSAVQDFTAGLGEHAKEIGQKVGEIVLATLNLVHSALQRVESILNRISPLIERAVGVGATLAEPVLEIFEDVAEDAAFVSRTVRGVFKEVFSLLGENSGISARLDKITTWLDNARESREVKAIVDSPSDLGLLKTALKLNNPLEEEDKFLEGIHRNVEAILNILYSVHKSKADLWMAAEFEKYRVRDARDLIISSDGQIFETAPTDSIFAIQNGRVSTQSSPVSGVSNRPMFGSDSSHGSSGSNVTNVYNSSSTIDSSGIDPFSEFCPVGV